jgi:hypothetical protein
MAKEGARFLVDTSPTKEVVVDGITRDATDEECIFDLIDNSIDAARNIIFRNISPKLRNELPDGYTGYGVKLNLGATSFKISDDCGGIPVENLRKNVLRFGERSDQNMGIGAFGVGLNRALFRLGNTAHIVTDDGHQRSELSLNKEKYLEARAWTVPAESHPSTNKIGTTIDIRHLPSHTSKNFGDERWVTALRHQIGRRYGRFIKKGLKLSVNNDAVENEEIKIREGGTYDIQEKFLKEGDVAIHIAFGQHQMHKFKFEKGHSEEQNRRLTTQYGWTILCNDRAVIMSDKTHKTGWEITKFHSDFYGFVGYVNFVCQDPSQLPWKTTKTDIDLNNPSYQTALATMRRFTMQWRSEANQRKKPQKEQPTAPPPKPKEKENSASRREPAKSRAAKAKVEKPVTKPDHNQFRTVLPNDINEVHCFDKHLALVREAKRIDAVENAYTALALIRMLFECSAVKFMERHGKYDEMKKLAMDNRRKKGVVMSADDEQSKNVKMDEMLAYFANNAGLWGTAKQNYLKHSVSKMAAYGKVMNTVLHNPYQPTNRTQALQIRDEVLPLLRHLIET